MLCGISASVEPALGLDHPVNLASSEHPLTEDELAESIRAKLAAGTSHYIAAGLDCIEAKKRLKGRFTVFVETKLGWNIDTIDKWMEIARAFSDSATWRSLPSGWTTLYVLTRIPKTTRESWIADGTIHAQLTHKDAERLVRKAHESNGANRGISTDDNRDVNRDASRDDGHDEDRDPIPTVVADATSSAAAADGAAGHTEPRGGEDRDRPTEGGELNARNSIGSDSPGEIARKLERAEELEREKRCWEIKCRGLENEVEELKARLGETNIPHQQKLFRQALRWLQRAESRKMHDDDRRSLRARATTDLIEFVRSAARDGLGLDRFDVICRPETH
jgi:hypothetical protein